jgi:hypothetical protein
LEVIQENFQRITSFEIIEQGLYGHSSTIDNWYPTKDFGVDVDRPNYGKLNSAFFILKHFAEPSCWKLVGPVRFELTTPSPPD